MKEIRGFNTLYGRVITGAAFAVPQVHFTCFIVRPVISAQTVQAQLNSPKEIT